MHDSWQQLREQLDGDPELVDVRAPSLVAGAADLMKAHADARQQIRRALDPDLQHLQRVRQLQTWADTYDVEGDEHRQDHTRALAKIGPDAITRADSTEAALRVLRAGRELADSTPPLELPAGVHDEPLLPPLSTEALSVGNGQQLMRRTLNHGPTRNALKLAGHPSMRKLAGYGRQHRGAPGTEVADEDAEAGQEPVPAPRAGSCARATSLAGLSASSRLIDSRGLRAGALNRGFCSSSTKLATGKSCTSMVIILAVRLLPSLPRHCK